MTTAMSPRVRPTTAARILGIAVIGSLILGAWAGLERAGVLDSGPALTLHGPLMVFGFLGTAITIERASAIRQGWAWAAPIACTVGSVLLVMGKGRLGASFFTLAGLVLCAAYIYAATITPGEPFILVMGLGALCWTIGTAALAAAEPVYRTVVAMGCFLVLTIVGERIELSRMGPRAAGRQVRVIIAASGIAVVAAPAAVVGKDVSSVAGLTLVALSLASAYGDIAFTTVRHAGLSRYMAVAILSGYVWLVVAGIVWILHPILPGTAAYDISLHAIFIGFALSMVMAHVAVIVPAVSGVDVTYHASWWAGLLLLQASLVIRIAGRLWSPLLYRTGAVTSVVAIALFGVLVVRSSLRSRAS